MGHVTSVLAAAAVLALGSPAPVQAQQQQQPVNPASPGTEMADVLIRQVSEDLRVKAVVGKPVTVGSVTLIPLLMIDVNFGGAGLLPPSVPPDAGPKKAVPPSPPAGGDAFLMSGEARPLGFVVVTRTGTRFISVAQPPAK